MKRHYLIGLSLCALLGACGADTSAPTATRPAVTEDTAVPAVVRSPAADGSVQLIFVDPSAEASAEDTALALALLNLGGNLSDDTALVAAANALLGTSGISGSITAPTATTADFAAPAETFDLDDIAVLFAAARVSADPLTETAIARGLSNLLGNDAIAATDILTVPSAASPNPNPTPQPSPTPAPPSPTPSGSPSPIRPTPTPRATPTPRPTVESTPSPSPGTPTPTPAVTPSPTATPTPGCPAPAPNPNPNPNPQPNPDPPPTPPP
ncbi:MAG: hypothetical protein AAFX40_05150, partial [Cyanobacteria bacterium J06639_1]